ncbi:MAG: elongation factor G-like protein EF-G2 [Actinomycetota bacterium]
MAQTSAGREPGVGIPRAPGAIRNVVLVGPSHSGKTTLVEHLALATDAISRAGMVEDGSTLSDGDDAEHRQQRSVSLSLVPVDHDGVRINLLDTPGYADFVGEVRAGLRAADAALFVVSAVDGVDSATSMLWDECAAVGMPRAIVITKADRQRADVEGTIEHCQVLFGDGLGVHPLYRPLHADDGHVAGLIGLLSRRIFDYSDGVRIEVSPDPEHLSLIEDSRTSLLEGIITESEDETLMDRFLAGDEVPFDTLVEDLEKAVARGHFFPVLITATSPVGFGMSELLEILVRGFPSPLEHPLPAVTSPDGAPESPLTCDPSGTLCAEVVKTSSDPYVGRMSLVRVFSGTLRSESTLHVSGHFMSDRGHDDHDLDERVGALISPLGKTQRAIGQVIAGDIAAVAKLNHAETGDTLSSPAHPLLIEPWVRPDPLLPVAIVAHASSDEDKLAVALARLIAEDPTMRLERNPETGQIVLWCMGEAHVDVVLDRLKARYGVNVDSEPLRVSLRETFTGPAKGHGRLVKQSGGHGQYAVCDIEVEPLPPGSGFEFVDRVVGGAVPRQFIPSVEKGVRAQMAKGVVAGYPVVDIRVTLVDGKAHSVDSSDMAFQMAGGLALKEAAAAAHVSLLEPVDEVLVLVPDEYVGAVMSDLSGRRGRVTGSEGVGAGRTKITAEVPGLELTRYAIDLRSLAHGTATFTRRYRGHEAMPAQVAQGLASTG